jgi:DNA polymerase-3 subunit alpha (Gram-positive type)
LSGQDLKDILITIGNDPRFHNKIKQDRAEFCSETKMIGVYYATTVHLVPADYIQLRNALSKHNTRELSFYLTQSSFADDFQQDQKALEQCVKDFCAIKQPMILPFLIAAEIIWREANIAITFESEIGKDLFSSLGLKADLTEYFWDVYHMEVSLELLVDANAAGTYQRAEVTIADMQMSKKKESDAFVSAWERKRTEEVSVAWKDDATIPICRLQKDEKTIVTIDGEVVATEDVSIRDGEYIKHKFVVCDYTGSVTCFFIECKKFRCKMKTPKKGKWVRISGIFKEDGYEKESTVTVKEIRKSAHKVRTDMAPKKRVELHVHTQMSAEDAVSSIKSIVERAAQWGHKAIAVTDHGVAQAFPEAAFAAKANKIKIIYGVEAYMFDDTKRVCDSRCSLSFNDEYIVFDIETTGLNAASCDITEIGAVRVRNGELLDRFQTFVKPSAPIPPKIVSLTGITDDMVKDAPLPSEALRAFHAFCGKTAVLVAHKAEFDTGFIFEKSKKIDIFYHNSVIDSLMLSRLAFPRLKNHKLNTVAQHLHISFKHHRAINDAVCTARIMLECFRVFQKLGIVDMQGVNSLLSSSTAFKNSETYHAIILCKNKRGLRNLYKLISDAHLDYFYRRPRMPKSLIRENREGLILGSACESGELYTAVVKGANEQRLFEIASFYDYFEIQPLGNNDFLVQKGVLGSLEDIKKCNMKIVDLGKKLKKPVVATCDVHFLDPYDEYFRRILFHVQKYEDTAQAPLFLRTTEEMLEEFSYLGEGLSYEVVVENSNRIADMIELIDLFQPETAMPVIPNATEKTIEIAYQTARTIYGDPLPEIVDARLKRELNPITEHGFSVLYYSAHALVKKSNEDGYLVGSRGSVGSSFAATMMGITEVNPLPPHYVCPQCKYSEFNVDKEKYACGVDLPDAICPKCGAPYKKDGFDIPFEVFLGLNADKVPDIDLNFSGEYQGKAHKYTELLFGKGHVFRAGTISAIQDKTAYGYVKKYLGETGTHANEAEINRLVQGISGVKKTTGQHPGGMIILPADREIYEFTPVQRPADKQDSEFITTHFDFNSMHDVLIKLDILGHDVPTIIRILQDLTGMDPLSIPLDDRKTMELFSGLDPLDIKPEQLLGIRTGTLGIPEFGTKFVRQMLMETKPSTMAEIVRISGLSHGTGVWVGNAQTLIKNHICTLKEAICTRDDIMNYLEEKGVEKRMAFFIMEDVRKGNVARKGFKSDQEKALKNANIPEWFIESCKKIEYMFPKAHAAAYVIMAYRIAYCKVYHKEAFYASYFTVRAGEFDATYVLGGMKDIKKNWNLIEGKGRSATANEKNMASMLEVACEMYLRGLHFLPVDLQRSDAVKFLIEPGGLRLPFLSIPQLGENAAQSIAIARESSPFLSIEDLQQRGRVSVSVVEEMRKMGTLVGLPESNQLSLFDL